MQFAPTALLQVRLIHTFEDGIDAVAGGDYANALCLFVRWPVPATLQPSSIPVDVGDRSLRAAG
jgi:hypothetical protein